MYKSSLEIPKQYQKPNLLQSEQIMMKLLTLTIISCHLVSVYSKEENNVQDLKTLDNQESEIAKRPFFGKR